MIVLPAHRTFRAGWVVLAVAILLASFPGGSLAAASPTGPAASATGPAASASQIVPGRVDRTSLALVGRYTVSLGLGFNAGTIDVSTRLEVQNASPGPIDRLELNTIAARLGRLRLGTVSVDGRRVHPTIDDQTLVVPLGGVLPPRASTTVRVHYSATLRRTVSGSDWLFAKANGIVDLYRWIPWLSVRRPFDRPNNGDPFLTVTSPLVTVTVTTDRPLVIAATGRRIARQGLVQTFEARDVRDVTITASPFYRLTTATLGPTTIQVFAKPGFPAATVLGYARTAVARMGALVGTYPYVTYTVAQSDLMWLSAST